MMIALRQRSRAELDRCVLFLPELPEGGTGGANAKSENLSKILTVEKACCDVFRSGCALCIAPDG